MEVAALVSELKGPGTVRGTPVAVAISPGTGLGLATAGGSWSVADAEPWSVVAAVEAALHPRWVMWSAETALVLSGRGVRVATAWQIAAVHRLLFGGWVAGPDRAWACLHALPPDNAPTGAPPDLFSSPQDEGDGPEVPVRPDGYLRPDWVAGGWRASPGRLRLWAGLAVRAAELQRRRLEAMPERPLAVMTARCESVAELLCAEMATDGLPMDRAAARDIIAAYIGPRPRDGSQAAEMRMQRDAKVLSCIGPGATYDLRSSAQVKQMLAVVGLDVADTRAWRLREIQDRHPVVAALLGWRKAERMATTYGYTWLDAHLGDDGRLRGVWAASDGAAGRMTASAGLHNMPAELRPAVVAEPGHLFVRADLGQVEPRVLAAVSADPALIQAASAGDLYAPVAAQLGVDRPTAKVAVLGAMYGQRSGHGGQALGRLEAAYPVAMRYLESAARAGGAGRDIRTHGGRLVRMGAALADASEAPEERSASAARGRYARNAVVQGAAAELFKAWAVTVRARARGLGASIVLCVHDELLVHVPSEQATAVAGLVVDCLGDAVQRWAPGTQVRFPADVSLVRRWSDAKAAAPFGHDG